MKRQHPKQYPGTWLDDAIAIFAAAIFLLFLAGTATATIAYLFKSFL